jgi:hypothetical protein
MSFIHVRTQQKKPHMWYSKEVEPFAFELAGQERQPSRFLDRISRLGKISYEIQTSLNGKSARLCFFPGQLKRKRLYMLDTQCEGTVTLPAVMSSHAYGGTYMYAHVNT